MLYWGSDEYTEVKRTTNSVGFYFHGLALGLLQWDPNVRDQP